MTSQGIQKNLALSNLLKRYTKIREYSKTLCAPFKEKDYLPQRSEFTSSPIWHLGHTTWFFEEMVLEKHVAGYKVFNPDFTSLFTSYENEIDEQAEREQRELITQPTKEEVYNYRKQVDQYISELLETKVSAEVQELLTLSLQHEQQHQELLLTDLKFGLNQNSDKPVYHQEKQLVQDINQEEGWIELDEGEYKIGHDQRSFYFDNELGRHKTYLQEYEISKALVTNGEYIEFMEAGGYQQSTYWLGDGWTWVNKNNIDSPLYWEKKGESWFYYTLAGMKKVNPEAILSHISFYEADAYASWKGCRLPTEFEWEVAADKLKWGKRWEWTNSAYLPYPGFKISPVTVGEYKSKLMINNMILRGSSVATPEGHSRTTYRKFLSPDSQLHYAGIRLARDIEEEEE